MTVHAPLISVLGVPTSAGSHNPGQELAPAAWREAGLIGELRAAGLDVEDRGDLPAEPFRPVSPAGGLRDADRVAAIAQRVAASVAEIRAAGRLPLVLGGAALHFAGLTLDQASACLEEFAGGEKFGGLVITEVNPGNDPSGELLGALVKTVAGALAPAR